jgi:CRP-like cAMP-binding protein
MLKATAPLHHSELFDTLTEEEITKLAPLCSEFAAVEDSIVFTEGRNATHLYVVVEGQIALQKSVRVPHGVYSRRTTITMCRSGEIMGWSALVAPHRYALSALAWESSRLIRVDAKMLRRALEMFPEMRCKVMTALTHVMARRLVQTTDALVSQRQIACSRLQ